MIRAMLIFLLCFMSLPAHLLAQDIRIGVLAFQGSERAARDFEPTIAHLRTSLPQYGFTMLPLNLSGMVNAVERHEVDFIITNPGDYVVLESRFGVTRLATLESREHDIPLDTVGSTVIVRAVEKRPGTLRDLAGARIAVVSASAFGGWQVIWREMDDAGGGVPEPADLVETGFPMTRVIAALRDGRATAGVVRTCLLEEEIANGRIGVDEFAVVGERHPKGFPCRLSSRLYPDWPFARLADTSPDLAKAITASLLGMVPVDGRAWTAPQDYNSVHALFRQLRIGPYDYLAHSTIAGFIKAHWHWFLAIGFGFMWWVIHVVRVESLVRRRTAELTREIQERAKAEEAARLHRQERDQFSRLGILGEMASNIAHELNQPLAAISNYAEGMTRLIDAERFDAAMLRDGARGIAGQADRAGVIIRRIRSFVRRREIRRDNLDINDVVRDAISLFEGSARRDGIQFHVRLEDGLPQVKADRIEMEQVMLNLLQNAIDAMNDAQSPMRGVIISTTRVDNTIEVMVRDHGSGLSADIEARLFETFFTTKPQGLGLGLSICRTIVEAHGGRLWASNEESGGVSMRFSLPVFAAGYDQ